MHEFFAGSGLVAYGLRGMFNPVWANDICEKKASVYMANFDDSHLVIEDIKNVNGNDLPKVDLSWASFPCQDLSLAGSLNGIDAERSGLVWEWLRVLGEMLQSPPMLVIENVLGLLTAKNGESYKRLHKALNDLGYIAGAIVVDAALFVPQSRPRVFVIAVKKGTQIPAELVDHGPNWLHNRAAAKLGNSLDDWVWWYAPKPQKQKRKLDEIIDFDLPYDKDNVLKLIPANHQRVLDAYDDIVAAGYRRTRNGKQSLELRFDGVAGCLRTPEGGSSKQFLVVKRNGEVHARLLSPRETARLMGAPDTYTLPGSLNDGYKAMGDAVALPVANFIGSVFLSKLAEAIHV